MLKMICLIALGLNFSALAQAATYSCTVRETTDYFFGGKVLCKMEIAADSKAEAGARAMAECAPSNPNKYSVCKKRGSWLAGSIESAALEGTALEDTVSEE